MPLIRKNEKIRVSPKMYTQNHQPESKKIILIELTSILIVTAFILFRTVLYFWSDDLWPGFTVAELQDLLPSIASWLSSSPPFIGALISFVTWHLMYFDSATPGTNPPTPLSPSKYRAMSGADVHLNFLFAMTIGPVVTTLMYIGYI